MNNSSGLYGAHGCSEYVGDIAIPGCVYAFILRSPHPHARIVSVNLSGALDLHGVITAIDGTSFSRNCGLIPSSTDEPPLARSVVRYAGEPVAAVLGTTSAIARNGASRVCIDYSPLPFSPDAAGTLRTEAPRIHESHPENILRDVDLSFGPVDDMFTSATTIVSGTYDYAGSTHAALEPHGVVAWWRPEGRLWVFSSTQSPHHLHVNLARILGLEQQAIRVIKPRVGGGFGGKCETFSHEVVAAQLSLVTGLPVKIVLSREEVFYTHRGRHHALIDIRLGINDRRELLAVDAGITLEGGAYAGLGVVTSYYAGQFLAIPYALRALRFRSRRVFTNAPPAGPKRGHGGVQIRFAFERLLDTAARRLDIDPLIWRKSLALRPGDTTVNNLTIGSCGLTECLDRVAEASGWHGDPDGSPHLGVAASGYMSGAGFPILPNRLPHSQSIIRADRSGLISVSTGIADIGQGAENVMRQLVAHVLDQDPRYISVTTGDTDLCPVDLGSYSSRVTLMAGRAVLTAARRLRETILESAASRLKQPVDKLMIRRERIVHRDNPDRGISLRKAIALAEERYGVVVATGSYRPGLKPARYPGSALGPSPAYSFTAAVARVTVDPDLYRVNIHDLWIAHDCGKAIVPAAVRAQIHGCAIMGIGETLYERVSMLRGVTDPVTFESYGIPLSGDTPRIHAITVESPDPEGPLGAKEAGEGPLLAVIPAIANAVSRALGIDCNRIPLNPETLWMDVKQAIKDSRES